MSINLMSAIFRTEFRDLEDEGGHVTKASTAKFVCIALADHANDEGESAYPSIGKLAYKTSLSRTTVINALDALKYNGILFPNGTSKHSTINYTINVECFSRDSQPTLLVNPLDSPSQPTLPPPVNPVDPNHPLTITEPYNGDKSPNRLNELPVEWQIAGNVHTVVMPDQTQAQRLDAANLIATGTGGNAERVRALVFAFQDARNITFTNEQVKGQRKAAVEMAKQNITPAHIRQAVRELLENNMTVTDLYSVRKTAINIANPPPTKAMNPQGLEIGI